MCMTRATPGVSDRASGTLALLAAACPVYPSLVYRFRSMRLLPHRGHPVPSAVPIGGCFRNGRCNAPALLIAFVALAVAGDDIRSHLQRGLEFGKQGRWSDALGELKAAVKLEPGSAEAHYSLGVALFWTRRWPAARQELERALHINPRLAEAHFFLGHVLENSGD